MILQARRRGVRVAQFIHQAQAGHGVLGVADGVAVCRRDFQAREFVGERRAADEQRHGDARFAQIGGGDDHLLRAFHEQAGEADGVGLVLVVGLIKSSGGTLMPRLITS